MSSTYRPHQDRQHAGQVIVLFLVLMTVGLILSTGLLSLQNHVIHDAKVATQRQDATYLAEAGINHALASLGTSDTVNDTEFDLGHGSFIVQDLTGSGNERLLESTGYIPNATSPLYQRKIRAKVDLSSDDVQFFYGVQIDSGGLKMAKHTRVYGNIFSNGNVIGDEDAVITGDVTVAGGLPDSPTVQWTTQDTDQTFATTINNRDIAQSFTSTADGALSKVSVYLAKVGAPTSNITLRITADNGNKPATTSLASADIAYVNVGTTPSWIDVSFTSAPTLINLTKYWIVLDYGSHSGTDHWNWRKDASDGYVDNTGKTTKDWDNANATWASVSGDLAFKTWIGGTPTRIDTLTIGDATTGTGRANQFVSTTIHGASCPNQYCIVENQSRINLPISDGVIQDWKNAAAVGDPIIGDYTISASQSLGPKHITGNLRVGTGETLTVTGTLWVEGSFISENNSIIELDSGYGAGSGVIIADGGDSDIANGTLFSGSGTAGSYIMLLSTLNDSTQVSIDVSNNSDGVIYYAGKSRIHFNNHGAAQEVTAYGIDLDEHASITYDSGLANANFTSGPGGGWSLKRGSIQDYK